MIETLLSENLFEQWTPNFMESVRGESKLYCKFLDDIGESKYIIAQAKSDIQMFKDNYKDVKRAEEETLRIREAV